MDKKTLIELRNKIGSLPAFEGGYATDDNIAIALVMYFQDSTDRPEDDKIDNECGWSCWAMEKVDNALDRIILLLHEKFTKGEQ